jgi:methylated-DNA-protein-cysteine methyltransferase-like protein
MNGATPFRERVIAVVRAIPRGRVLTYGQVAFLVGTPRGARQVGRVLYQLGPLTNVPWQRVVNRFGGLSTYKIGAGELQRRRLEAEGIRFTADGTVDLESYQWRPKDKTLRRMKAEGKG